MSSERAAAIPYQHIPHPTSPESGGATPERIKKATAAMLRKWNAALEAASGGAAPRCSSPFCSLWRRIPAERTRRNSLV